MGALRRKADRPVSGSSSGVMRGGAWVTYSSLGWVTVTGLGDLPQGGDSAFWERAVSFLFSRKSSFI